MSSKARLSRWFVLAACATNTACVTTSPIEPEPELPLIHAVLNAAADSQFVHVTGTRGGLEAVSASITVGSKVIQLAQRIDTAFHGGTSKGPFVLPTFDAADRLQPGVVYRLDVQMRHGSRITSTAVVPNVAPSLTIDTATYVFGRELEVNWTRVSGVKRYYVTVVEGSSGLFGNPVQVLHSRLADSAFVLTQAQLYPSNVYARTNTFQVSVSVVDEHLEEYYAVRTDPFSGTSMPTQFSNAYGVFGAVVPIMRTRYTVQPSGPPFPLPASEVFRSSSNP